MAPCLLYAPLLTPTTQFSLPVQEWLADSHDDERSTKQLENNSWGTPGDRPRAGSNNPGERGLFDSKGGKRDE